jgi:predicted ATP-dependent endonuclease of OLD family
MLKKLKIENFRCFKSFELNHLGKVNLLVGENNSGKTSILEALNIFYSGNILKTLKQIMNGRGEFFDNNHDFDISHLFYKHKFLLNNSVTITGLNLKNESQVKLTVKENLAAIESERLMEWIEQKDINVLVSEEISKFIKVLKEV